jgi:hypothetical protein
VLVVRDLHVEIAEEVGELFFVVVRERVAEVWDGGEGCRHLTSSRRSPPALSRPILRARIAILGVPRSERARTNRRS